MPIGACSLLHPLVLMCVPSLVRNHECIHICASLRIYHVVFQHNSTCVHFGVSMHVAA